jgi:hypothetical protein
MGTVSGLSSFEKFADSSEYKKRNISYGELQGTCDSGFSLQINETGEWNVYAKTSDVQGQKSSWTQSGIYAFDVADSKFFARWRKLRDTDEFLYQWWGDPHTIREKKKHRITKYSSDETPTADDSVPDDIWFTPVANSNADKLAEELNKIHWACLSQQSHTQ